MMVEHMMENGKTVKWRAKAILLGKMEENILDYLKMIKKKGRANLYGLIMKKFMKETGKMTNLMVLDI